MDRITEERPVAQTDIGSRNNSARTGQGEGQPRYDAQVERGQGELILRYAEEWRAMLTGGACDQPFYRPEWIHAAASAFGRKATVLLITVRQQGRLRAVLPLLEEKRRLPGRLYTTLRSVTHPDYSCRFDLIRGPGNDAAELATAAWDSLRTLPEWDFIEITNVPENGGAEALLHAAAQDGYLTWQRPFVRSPYIVLDSSKAASDFTQYVRSPNLGRKMRHGLRVLQKSGNVTLRCVDHDDPEEMKRFYDLEGNGWKGRTGSAIACLPEVAQFYSLVAAEATRYGYFSLYVLEISGRLLAAHFGMTFAGRYFPLKIAYDEKYGSHSPGHIMLGLVIQDIAKRGVTECECLGDSEDWKMRWLAEIRPHNFCYIYRKSLMGGLAYTQMNLQYWSHSLLLKYGRPLVRRLRKLRTNP